MNVKLTPELEKWIEWKVSFGEFESESALVERALWQFYENQIPPGLPVVRTLDDLRRAWQEGIDSGPATDWDMKETFNRAKRRAETEKAKQRG